MQRLKILPQIFHRKFLNLLSREKRLVRIRILHLLMKSVIRLRLSVMKSRKPVRELKSINYNDIKKVIGLPITFFIVILFSAFI